MHAIWACCPTQQQRSRSEALGQACYHNCTTFTKPIQLFKKKNLSRHFMFQHCQPMRNHHTEQLQGGNGKINSEKVSEQSSSIRLVPPYIISPCLIPNFSSNTSNTVPGRSPRPWRWAGGRGRWWRGAVPRSSQPGRGSVLSWPAAKCYITVTVT